MSDKPDKRSTFPLPLSSVTGDKRAGPAFAPAKVATPQTATRNAAGSGAKGNPGNGTAGGAPHYVPRVAAAPARTQGDAYQRAQPLPVAAPRPDTGVSDAIRRVRGTTAPCSSPPLGPGWTVRTYTGSQ